MEAVMWSAETEPRAIRMANGNEMPLTDEQVAKVAAVLTEAPTWTPEQAAQYLGVSRPMVVRWINDGLLEDRMVGNRHRIPVESVMVFQRARVSAGRFAVAIVEQAATDERAAEAVAVARARAVETVARLNESR